MTEKTSSLRNGVFCVLIFLACFWAAWPVAQIPFNDDWSYMKTTQVFAQTGHVAYNGWEAAMLGWQIPWGALFIKLFGFSYMTVKLSILPVAVVTLLLFYAILLRFEITPRNAVIGTLTLGLSPLFLPLAATFMTDIPALFVILLCLYCCQRAVAAGSHRAAIAWLIFAAASNVVGGTVRQIAWLGVLVMVPSTGWLLRKRHGMVVTTALLWAGSIGAILCCLHWFAHQPYTIRTPLFPKLPSSLYTGMIHALLVAVMFESLLFSLVLFVFPLLVVWLPHFGRKLDHYLALLCAGLLPLGAIAFLLGSHTGIWPPLILVEELAQRKHGSGRGWAYDVHHSLIPVPFQFLISLIAITAFFGLVFAVQDRGWKKIGTSHPSAKTNMVWLLLPFSTCYLLLLLRQLWRGFAFDRYMLGVMPFAIIALLWLHQEWLGSKLPRAMTALLVIYAALGIAGTHNYFAWQRARLAGIRELRDAGVARTEIQGGLVYDAWTQASVGGYVHDPLISYPPNAARAEPKSPASRNPCADNYLPLFPEILPKYEVGFVPLRCYLPSQFPAVHYTAWLPPFRRTVEIGRVPKGWTSDGNAVR